MAELGYYVDFLTPGGPVRTGPFSTATLDNYMKQIAAAQKSPDKRFISASQIDGALWERVEIYLSAVYGFHITRQLPSPSAEMERLAKKIMKKELEDEPWKNEDEEE